MNHKSDVARLREQIDLECQAIRRVFEEPAMVASHQSIDARYRNLHTLQEKLKPLVGEREATSTLMEIYHNVVDAAPSPAPGEETVPCSGNGTVSPSCVSETKVLHLVIYLVVDENDMEQGAEGFLIYAKDNDEELNAAINALPAEKRRERAYLDVRTFTHGLTLADGTIIPPTSTGLHELGRVSAESTSEE